MKEEQKYDLQCMHITVWMAGNAFKIDRISRLEEDWNGRYELLLYTILKIVRSDTSEYAISFLRKKKFFPSIQEI